MEVVADILKFLFMIDDYNFLSSALGLRGHTVELTDLARLYYYILIETVSQSVSLRLNHKIDMQDKRKSSQKVRKYFRVNDELR